MLDSRGERFVDDVDGPVAIRVAAARGPDASRTGNIPIEFRSCI